MKAWPATAAQYLVPPAALGMLCAMPAGYVGRFEIMSRHAKTGTPRDRRYFVEEHMTTPVVISAYR
jgi:hypothetical protein